MRGVETILNDLIYCNGAEDYNEIKDLLKKRFSEIVIKDASDDVHQYRFRIELPDEKKREYLKFTMEKGFYNLSLGIRLDVEDKNSENYKLITEIVNELNNTPQNQSPEQEGKTCGVEGIKI